MIYMRQSLKINYLYMQTHQRQRNGHVRDKIIYTPKLTLKFLSDFMLATFRSLLSQLSNIAILR